MSRVGRIWVGEGGGRQTQGFAVPRGVYPLRVGGKTEAPWSSQGFVPNAPAQQQIRSLFTTLEPLLGGGRNDRFPTSCRMGPMGCQMGADWMPDECHWDPNGCQMGAQCVPMKVRWVPVEANGSPRAPKMRQNRVFSGISPKISKTV